MLLYSYTYACWTRLWSIIKKEKHQAVTSHTTRHQPPPPPHTVTLQATTMMLDQERTHVWCHYHVHATPHDARESDIKIRCEPPHDARESEIKRGGAHDIFHSGGSHNSGFHTCDFDQIDN